MVALSPLSSAMQKDAILRRLLALSPIIDTDTNPYSNCQLMALLRKCCAKDLVNMITGTVLRNMSCANMLP